MSRTQRFWLGWLGIAGAFLLAVEATSRLDDWFRLGVPVLASPDAERDLRLADEWGVRGRPNGLHRKWKLNEFGFRGPEMAQEPPEGTTRVMVLGSSETIGLLEGPDKEYPAQLRSLLAHEGRYEVVNGAIAGMSVGSMIRFWEHWASRFQPHIVLIDPCPLFYLDAELPSTPKATVRTPSDDPVPVNEPALVRSRAVERAVAAYRAMPLWFRNIRRDWILRRELASHPPEWIFSELPKDRLEAFLRDVKTLVDVIRDRGAVPILITYPISATSPPRPEDALHLRDMRFYYARATEEMLAAFQTSANDALRQLAAEENLRLIDAAAVLDGRRELFGDLVHFTDGGAALMAETLAAGLVPSRSTQAVSRTP